MGGSTTRLHSEVSSSLGRAASKPLLLRGRGECFGSLACLSVGSLLGTPDQAALRATVNATVAVVGLNRFLDDDLLPGFVREPAYGLGKVANLAKFEDESVLDGRFRSCSAGAFGDEVFDGHVRCNLLFGCPSDCGGCRR